MRRRRLVALGGTGLFLALLGLARVLAPDRFDAAVQTGADVVEQTPDPVVLAASVVVSTVVLVALLIYVVRVYYWAWLQIEGPVTRFWNALLPESPIIRFGVGLILMVAVFLIGPLVVLSALDFFEDSEHPVDDQRTEPGDDEEENTTDDGTENAGTANLHAADEPDSPDEPPGGRVHPRPA
jgi:hypothetical protein